LNRVYLLFFAACLGLVLFFHQGRSFNPVSRLLTVFAVVEDHTLRADRFRSETGDYAEVGGHTYSDKAPLSSFLVLPFYAAYRQAFRGPLTEVDKEVACHLGTVLGAAVPFALFALMLLWRLLGQRTGPRAAVWWTLGGAFGTCLANYGGTFFGHMLAATLFLGSYVLACEREERFVLAGFLGGCAVVTEYPLVLTQVLIAIYLVIGPDRWRRTLRYGLGALPMALCMFAWNRAVTGRWLDFPYSHVPAAWAPMQHAFGIRLPDPSAAWELAFGQYRGLAFYASILLVCVPALLLRFAGPPRRRTLVLALLGSLFLFVSAYFKWDGGWCTGPRHLAPLIVLGVYEGVAALARLRRGRVIFASLAVWGALLTVCASATDCLPAENFQRPAFEVFFPRALRGDATPHNLASELLRVHTSGTLLPIWIGLLLLAGWGLGRALERAQRRRQDIAAVLAAPRALG
jgi:hypothetical protein